jgi:hypothetical protein
LQNRCPGDEGTGGKARFPSASNATPQRSEAVHEAALPYFIEMIVKFNPAGIRWNAGHAGGVKGNPRVGALTKFLRRANVQPLACQMNRLIK